MTTKLVLDGNAIDSEADFHDMIDRAARSAGFAFYGRNLDALWNVLTAILPQPVEVRWLNAESCRVALGDRFERILAVFRDAEDELGSAFQLRLEP